MTPRKYALTVDSKKNPRYDSRDVGNASEERFPDLYHALELPITEFILESRFSGSQRPDFYFKLGLGSHPDRNWAFVRLSIRTERSEGKRVRLLIEPLPRDTLSRDTPPRDAPEKSPQATAAFWFKLRYDLTLKQVVEVIWGSQNTNLPLYFRFNLVRSEFSLPKGEVFFAGRRDWM